MKTLLLFLVCGLAAAGSAQQPQKTFTSPDGLFRFHYSDMLVNCSPRQTPNGPASAIESCMSQGAVCGGPGSDATALACFAYPKERFKDKPLFVAATFFVSEIRSAKTEKACLDGSSDWFVINSKEGTTTINGVAFKAFEIGDNWAGGGQSGPIYRTFHHDRCYELGMQTVVSRAAYDPETDKEFTKQDGAEVEGRLGQALNSFVFLK
jgi:hypothetical protein